MPLRGTPKLIRLARSEPPRFSVVRAGSTAGITSYGVNIRNLTLARKWQGIRDVHGPPRNNCRVWAAEHLSVQVLESQVGVPRV